MQIYNKLIKLGLGISLISVSTLFNSCGTENINKNKIVSDQNTIIQSNENFNYKDWTFDRVINNDFKIKSTGLKPIFDADNSVIDLTKTLSDTTLNKNSRAKSFGSISTYPVIDLNNPGVADDFLYFTSDNETGSNIFALNSSGAVVWENKLSGSFIGNSPTIRTLKNKKLMYVSSTSGEIFCLDTTGRVIKSVQTGDSFKNTSVWVETDPNGNFHYVYAVSQQGNLYKYKLDMTNSQTETFTREYAINVANTAFSSSPVVNNSSLYVGGENGVLYEIIPNTGDTSRTWNLSLHSRNGAASIHGTPVFNNNTVIIPAGGYLFRIDGSTVTQSPLLELNQGLNSRIQPFGSVFKNNSYPTGVITTSPVIDPGTTNVYISNGNAVFEIDFSTISNFENSANFCLSLAGRVDTSDKGLIPGGNGSLTLTKVGGNGATKIAMVDTNYTINSNSSLNFFTTPIATNKDSLEKYLNLKYFDSKGHIVNGLNSRIVSDNNGNVYFTVDNGTVNIYATP